ncbi:MAG: glycosyltransferase family 2 protein [Paracoccaceae bacterium]
MKRGSSFKPRVAVLMATHNGADYVGAQLQSFASQSLKPHCIVVSDDNSDDATLEIVKRFANRHPDLSVRLKQGPGQGSSANFLSLLDHTPDETDMIAFSDQDDVWLPHKLERAATLLERAGTAPGLYCGRTHHASGDLSVTSQSRSVPNRTDFRNALVQNVAAGNTIVLNGQAMALAQAAGSPKVVVHDWWLYLLITGAGGQIVYDNDLLMYYRQHGQNVIGANEGIRSQAQRLRMMINGTLKDWNAVNVAALEHAIHLLTDENADLLRAFSDLRQATPSARLTQLKRLGLYRQGRLGQASLWLAALLGKL